MASNEDLISGAVDDALNNNEVDLLLISKLDNGSSPNVPDYGMQYKYLYVGMSGQKLIDGMNENLKATDVQFAAHNEALQIRIISNQIKEIKEENGIVSYTTDGETWNSLISTWGKIQGDITKQTDLQDLLTKKVGVEDFQDLKDDVNLVTNTTVLLQADTNTLKDTVNTIIQQLNSASGILVRLNDLETIMRTKIGSDNVLQIRESGGALEYTTNGEDWLPVSTVGVVDWGSIMGNIDDQNDLYQRLLLIQNIAQSAKDKVDEISTSIEEGLKEHKEDYNNPHRVSMEQVGIHLCTMTEFDSLPKTDSELFIVDDTMYIPNEVKYTIKLQGGYTIGYSGDKSYDDIVKMVVPNNSMKVSTLLTSLPFKDDYIFVGISLNPNAVKPESEETEVLPEDYIYGWDDTVVIANEDTTFYCIWKTPESN